MQHDISMRDFHLSTDLDIFKQIFCVSKEYMGWYDDQTFTLTS